MTRILVDGVFFQLNDTGIARVWRSLLTLLAAQNRFELFMLDRGNAPEIEGVERIAFQRYLNFQCPADSSEIQVVCDKYHIDAFTSTYYTTPLKTPMLLMVYDMIPEVLGYDLNPRPWMEKAIAINYALRYLCISHCTCHDLLAIYPEIPESQTSVAHCGIDAEKFFHREKSAVESFLQDQGIERPYFLFVGSRGHRAGTYKNSRLFFEAVQKMRGGFDIVCVGGEEKIEPAILALLPEDVNCYQLRLSDDELALTYSGAIALVYPSLYEGFGMPVIEAMACGCPVITTQNGSLGEASGGAALSISGTSVEEMYTALREIQSPQKQKQLRTAGLVHSRQFCWDSMARQLALDFDRLVVESREQKYIAFAQEWARLRQLQAKVDELE